MKYFLSENQIDKLFFLRRLPEFEKHLKNIVRDDHPCNYEDAKEYAMIMIEDSVLNTFGHGWNEYDYWNEFEPMNELWKMYGEKLMKRYKKEKCDE